ncbi:unnamed protein product [Caretta caretta]
MQSIKVSQMVGMEEYTQRCMINTLNHKSLINLLYDYHLCLPAISIILVCVLYLCIFKKDFRIKAIKCLFVLFRKYIESILQECCTIFTFKQIMVCSLESFLPMSI